MGRLVAASRSSAGDRLASSQGQDVAGTVRIAASEVVGVEVLPPILASLRERHPELDLTLTAKAEA